MSGQACATVARSAGIRRGIADGSWALIGQIGSGLMLLAGTRLLTELVAPAVFGQVALLSGLIGLGVTLFGYPFVSAGMRLLPEYLASGRQDLLFRALANLIGRSGTVAVILLSAAGVWFVRTGQLAAPTVAVAALLLLVTLRREVRVQLLIGQRRQRDASLWQTLDGMLRPALAVTLVWWGGADAGLILLGYCLAGLLANAVCGLAFGTGPSGKPAAADATGVRAEILRYALPLIPMELLSWFNALGDRYVIGYFMTAADVGLYAAAYTLTNEAFHRAAIVLLRSFQPVYFGHHAHQRRADAARVYRYWVGCVLLLGLAGVTAMALLKDWVAALLLAEVYRDAARLMPIIGLGCALQALGTVMAQPLYAAKTTGRLLQGRVLGAAAAAIALPLMVQSNGLAGAAWAAPVYFGVEAMAFAVISWHTTRRRLTAQRERP